MSLGQEVHGKGRTGRRAGSCAVFNIKKQSIHGMECMPVHSPALENSSWPWGYAKTPCLHSDFRDFYSNLKKGGGWGWVGGNILTAQPPE